MDQLQNDYLEFIVDDFEDYLMYEDRQQQLIQRDSDVTDDIDMNKRRTDTSAIEARNGKDIQGIPWEKLNYTRDKYRATRLKQYKNYENLPGSTGYLDKAHEHVEKRSTFYDFQFNTRLVKSTIVHFQVGVTSRRTDTQA